MILTIEGIQLNNSLQKIGQTQGFFSYHTSWGATVQYLYSRPSGFGIRTSLAYTSVSANTRANSLRLAKQYQLNDNYYENYGKNEVLGFVHTIEFNAGINYTFFIMKFLRLDAIVMPGIRRSSFDDLYVFSAAVTTSRQPVVLESVERDITYKNKVIYKPFFNAGFTLAMNKSWRINPFAYICYSFIPAYDVRFNVKDQHYTTTDKKKTIDHREQNVKLNFSGLKAGAGVMIRLGKSG
ncbi:MAG: hypothetical protein ACK40G_04470 [Cytophagaceae bacterium]